MSPRSFLGSRKLLAGIVAMALMSSSFAEETNQPAPPALAFSMKNIDGQSVELSKYEGKVVLFVNVASKCGYTKQYTGLQQLHEKYNSKGLAVIGVPCNQFGGQEPGSNDEIKQFCSSKYNVTFDMLDKVTVNDDTKGKACPLYGYLTGVETKPAGKGNVKWNFEKFLVDRKGNVIGRFGSGVEPMSAELTATIEKALGN
ncbi:MAG: glutathione peroxidase [Planctomycetota bacterium]|nr:glutathione peroxidase [Planctomycetota bacterium]